MVSGDGSCVAIFNGEIYNYIELRDELREKGYEFRTQSDTEVLLNGYREWGNRLPERLAGMFAFAIADRERRELLLVRDRFGEKPLFYRETEDSVTFASEARALAALPGLRREVNGDALAAFLCLNYVPGEETLLREIRRLPPATWRHYSAGGGVRMGTFWTPPSAERADVSTGEALEELQHLLDRSARMALRSDVPVGVFLSGGIDSSLVARSAARSGKLSRAYCLSFEESSYSEWEKAQETARQLGVPITRVVLGPAELSSFFEIVEHVDDPLADSSALAVWTISKEAARHNKVVLSGDGGDELFGGYLTYQATAVHRDLISRLPPSFRRMLGALGERLPTSERKVSTSYKLMRFLRAAPLPTSEAHFSWNGTWLPRAAAKFLSSDVLQARAVEALARLARKAGLSDRPSLRQLQVADTRCYLPDDILVKSDRMSMAHGLEVRAPLLDASIAEFALALPARLKTPLGGPPKKILRELARKCYGVAISSAKKQGFSIPVHAWLRGSGRELVLELLSSGSVARLGILEPYEVSRVVELHMSGRRSYGFELWGLMVLVAWHRTRIERAVEIPKEPAGLTRLTLGGPLAGRVGFQSHA
jgi:asparagine synthase (glutamine-hydrolysing)